jgi:predicted DNA-binding protein YlxM (UPF0122 family)
VSRASYTDQQLLTILEMKHAEGKSYTEIAHRFSTTRSAIAGIICRVRTQTNEHDRDGNQNGTMPPQWWKR